MRGRIYQFLAQFFCIFRLGVYENLRLFGAVALQIRADRTKSPEHQRWNGELCCALNFADFHRQFQPMSIEVPLSCLDALSHL